MSEGLAGHFVKRLFDTPPEPWECAVEPDTAATFFPKADELASTNYGHGAWFYGEGGKYPVWLGYTLGYVIVGRWLHTVPAADVSTLVNATTADVLSTWPEKFRG